MFMAHALMENRNGLLVDFLVSEARGRRSGMRFRCCWPGRGSAGSIPGRSEGTRATTRGVAWAMRTRGVTPHVAQNTSGRSSAIDGRTTRHRGYTLSHSV